MTQKIRNFFSGAINFALILAILALWSPERTDSFIREARAAGTIVFQNVLYLAGSQGATTKRTPAQRAADVFNVRDYGAVGDGASHPLSDYFGSLAAAQAVYPEADSLTNEIDWAAIQKAIDNNTVYATTTASSAAGTNTLTLDAVPSTVNTLGGFVAWDKNRPASIQPGTTVVGIAGNVITLSRNIVANGVANGDTIRFDFSRRGEVYIPAGSYKINRSLSMDKLLSIYIHGAGSRTFLGGTSCTPQAGTSQGYTIDKSPVYNPAAGPIVIEKMWVRECNSSYGAIRVSSSIGVAIRDVQVEGRIGVDTSSSTTAADVSVGSGGSGYVAGEVLTLGGGTTTRPVKLTVTAIGGGGAITAAVITDVGEYTAYPGSTNSPTGLTQSSSTGSGTGATFGLFIGGASQGAEVTNVSWGGGSGPNSTGVVIGANGVVSNFDTTGGGKTGIAAYGVGVNMFNNRLEVLDTGIALGVNQLFYGFSLSGFNIVGGSFESNLTAIDFMVGTGAGQISGIKIQAYLGAGPGGANPVYGINYRNESSHHVKTTNVSVGGDYSGGAAANVGDTANPSYLSFDTSEFGNTQGSAVIMPTKAHRAVWYNTSGNAAPVFLFANLPTAPLVGDTYSISDGAKKTAGGAAAMGDALQGGGSGQYQSRWNGTDWIRNG